jgi:DNA polymerase III alpha subunit
MRHPAAEPPRNRPNGPGSEPRAIGSGTLGSYLGERVQVAGLVAASRRTATRRGESMAFLTLDDPSGTAELTLFPATLERARGVFGHRGPLRAIGRPEAQHGAVSLVVERLAPLSEPVRGA